MKSLKNELRINNNIDYKTPYKNIEDIIKYVYSNEKYKFYLNSELIDVNDRFRIFELENKKYIVKKSNLDDGKNEYDLALKAKENIENLKVDGYTLKIVLPEIKIIDNDCYIITEYMGTSLQECNYNRRKKNKLSIDTVFNIIDLFLERNILYRGFLPRNMVIKGNKIYLLDWEDAIFNNERLDVFNLQWKTNFLVNWSYFYDYSVLKKRLDKYTDSVLKEPSLIKYETKFRDFASLKLNDFELRKYILEKVMESEHKIDKDSNKFIIPPNDMAHLISDLYNSDIDVLFDISSVVIRKYNEKLYIKIMEDLSSKIAESYISKYNIQERIINILIYFFLSAANKDKIGFGYNDILDLEKDKNEFINYMNKSINMIIKNFNNTNIDSEITNRITSYIYSFMR